MTVNGRAWRSLATSTVTKEAPAAFAPAAASFAAILSRPAPGVTSGRTATGLAVRARLSEGGRPAFSFTFGLAG